MPAKLIKNIYTSNSNIQICNIMVIGDSLIKDMKAFKMKQVMSKQDKVYIKSFPRATIECMHDYIKTVTEIPTGHNIAAQWDK